MAVAQLVELQIVVLAVAGSSPVGHPIFSRDGGKKHFASQISEIKEEDGYLVAKVSGTRGFFQTQQNLKFFTSFLKPEI